MEPSREYNLLPQGLAESRRTYLRRYWAPQFLTIAAVLVVSLFLGTRKAGLGEVFGFGLMTALLLVYILFISPRRARQRQAKCWDTYKLTIGTDYLLRQQADTPDVRLPFSAVRRAERLPGRYLRVIGSKRLEVIAIPESIENFQEVLGAVSRIAPPVDLKKDKSHKIALVNAGGFTAYMVMLWSHSTLIVVPLAVVVSGLLLWLFFYMQRSPNTSRRGKKISWVYLLCVGFPLLKIMEVLWRPQ